MMVQILLFLFFQFSRFYALQETTTPPLLSVPTYSLATLNDADGKTGGETMNILTYATPASIRPDRLWAIGLYKNTQSYENFVKRKEGVMQLLTTHHIPLVRLLGGSSGYDVDKQVECQKLGFDWVPLETKDTLSSQHLVLQGCASYLCLELQELVDGGSHDIAICRVKSMYADGESSNDLQLCTAKLRDLGIITTQGRIAEE